MTAEEIVLSFMASLALGLRALRSEFSGIGRDGPTKPLMGHARTGGSSRSGRIEGVGTYLFHGVGCRLELDSGEDVDFDWDKDGKAIFDVWRLRMFAESLGLSGIDDDALATACAQLVRRGILEKTDTYFFRVRGGAPLECG